MALKFSTEIAEAGEDQCNLIDDCEADSQVPLTSRRSGLENAGVKSPYALPPGATWGREYPFAFDDGADLNERLRIELLTRLQENALGLPNGALRPVIRYVRWAARIGSSSAGAFATVPVSFAYVNQAAPGAGDAFNTDIAPVFGSAASSFGYLEGPGRLGFGGVENGSGWFDFRLIVLSTQTAGVTGDVAVRLGWELKPAGAAAP